ncbi:uncharacterized protein [Clytia hemisphaerica]|uniref:Uncharacterized protein n=1 Tax=Clytia hemisphaerica TaxID=252671 RepID=A0A7M5XIQ2_9CNID
MGSWISFDRDSGSVEEVRDYCKSVIFVKFYGQTSSMKGETDKTIDAIDGCENLGSLIKELHEEVAKQKSAKNFEITDDFRLILRKIANLRLCNKDCETADHCYERLLKNADLFAAIYKKRGKLSQGLSEEHDHYWGTRQQMMCGKTIADWLEKREKKAKNSTYDADSFDPIFGVLLNPTGGRVGPGDTNWMHEALFDDLGAFAYHSAVHDGFGYLKTNHSTGPGYNYLNKGLFGDSSPLGGQISGISFWESTLDDEKPEDAPLDKFNFK